MPGAVSVREESGRLVARIFGENDRHVNRHESTLSRLLRNVPVLNSLEMSPSK